MTHKNVEARLDSYQPPRFFEAFLDLTVKDHDRTERSVVPVSASRSAAAGEGAVVVIGIGNEFRRDDGAGPAVVARLRDLAPPGVRFVITDGEPTRLIEAWTGAALAVVVDAVRVQPPYPGPPYPGSPYPGSPRPGQVHRFVVDSPGSGPGRAASSHGLGLGDAVRLAIALDRMPACLIVHAIEAADLTQGPGLTPPVAAAVGAVASAVLDDLVPYLRT